MADSNNFVTLRRATPTRQPVAERVRHWREFYVPMPEPSLRAQAGRCMDCGVAFCQGDTGCPVQNVIPEWNDLVRAGRWRDASNVLHSTNNFPELTGRLCPAPCESACVLSLLDEPVTIRSIEQSIVDRAFAEGWVVPQPPLRESGKSVAVVGSGPAGLAAAQQLRRAGHRVTVFERAARIGGLLRYGIPEFKLEKAILDRRLVQLQLEGIVFKPNVDVGVDLAVDELRAGHDAILLATGAAIPRDLSVAGRSLRGIHLAMDFLSQQNKRDAGEEIHGDEITATGKRVVIIGGGDTGSDCAGTCIRQRAESVQQFEVMPQPPSERSPATPWPLWPMQLRTSHAHEEGCRRDWSVATMAFTGRDGAVAQLHAVRVASEIASDGTVRMIPTTDTEFTIDADLVLLAMGFSGAEFGPLARALGVQRTRGVMSTSVGHATNPDGVFAAGDARRGASLIVWAIREGRDAAAQIDRYLAQR